MTVLPMRLPSSGPPLGQVPGGGFEGFRLRNAEAVTSLLEVAVTTGYAPIVDLSSVPVTATLLEPRAGRRYNVRCHFMVATVTDAAATLNIQLQGSYDGGTTWFELGGNSIATEANNENLTAYADFPMTLGAAMPTPVPESAIVLTVRCRVNASADDVFVVPTATGFGNKALLQLSELA